MSRGWLPALPLIALLLGFGTEVGADDVTIYRCTDATGKLTLRDSPCKRGEKQQTQSMLRPRDGKPTATAMPTPPAASASTATGPVRYVLQTQAQPLYQCVAPDGRSYLSESPRGQARWTPGWQGILTPPVYPPVRPAYLRGAYAGSLQYRDRHSSLRIGGGRDYIAGAPVLNPGYPTPPLYTQGAWMEDACAPLGRGEMCEVMSDRRHEIRRRYVQAMPSERTQLDRESANLDARLREECGL